MNKALFILPALVMASCASAPPQIIAAKRICPPPPVFTIPLATKALFPDAPTIANPTGDVNSVVAAGVIRASIENTAAHNEQIDANLAVLQDEQSAALERQNNANAKAWSDCQDEDLGEEPKPERKKRFGLF